MNTIMQRKKAVNPPFNTFMVACCHYTHHANCVSPPAAHAPTYIRQGCQTYTYTRQGCHYSI